MNAEPVSQDLGSVGDPAGAPPSSSDIGGRSRFASEPLALVAAFLGGVCLSLQARFNGTLGAPLSEPMVAAIWSFGSGLVLLVVALAVPGMRRGARELVNARRDGTLRWWECLGGLLGGAFVAVQTSTVATLGVAVFIVASVAAEPWAAWSPTTTVSGRRVALPSRSCARPPA